MEHDVFISYSRKDKSYVHPFADSLRKRGFSVWIDKDGIHSSDDFKSRIVEAINNSKCFLFFSSSAANRSNNTVKEVGVAVHLKKPILPVKLDEAPYATSVLYDLVNIDYIDATTHNNEFVLQTVAQSLAIHCGKKDQKPLLPKQKQEIRIHIKNLHFRHLLIIVLPILIITLIITFVKIVPSIHRGNLTGTTSSTNKPVPNNFVICPKGTLIKYKEYQSGEPVFRNIELDSFYISKYELTQKEWNTLMSPDTIHEYTEGEYPLILKGDSLPASNRDIVAACLYCNRRSKREGYSGFYHIEKNKIVIKPNGNGYRLPNKYEWAYAARGGEQKKTKYAAGDDLKEIAWYGGNSEGKPHNVGQKKPNSIGLYDMNGNVGETFWPTYDGSSRCYNGHHPSNYGYYIGFGEDEVWCSSRGIRLVYIPPSIKNHNIKYITIKNLTIPDSVAKLFL